MGAELTEAATIRPLTVEELPLCEQFALEFHEETQLPGRFSLSVFLANWTRFLSGYPAVLLSLWHGEALVGGLGAMVVPDLSDGRLTATELFWYVTKDARKGRDAWKLVEAFEAWGAEKQVEEYRLVHLLLPGEDPATVRLAPIYKRKGYRPLEVGYTKSAKGVGIWQ